MQHVWLSGRCFANVSKQEPLCASILPVCQPIGGVSRCGKGTARARGVLFGHPRSGVRTWHAVFCPCSFSSSVVVGGRFYRSVVPSHFMTLCFYFASAVAAVVSCCGMVSTRILNPFSRVWYGQYGCWCTNLHERETDSPPPADPALSPLFGLLTFRVMKALADVSQQRRKLESTAASIAAKGAAASARLAQDSRDAAAALFAELRARREASKHQRHKQQLQQQQQRQPPRSSEHGGVTGAPVLALEAGLKPTNAAATAAAASTPLPVRATSKRKP